MGDAAPPPSTPSSWSKTFDYYNLLKIRKNPRPPTSAPVYSRDFAYADNKTVVLAHPMRAQRADINAETSAKTFAEYVTHPTPWVLVYSRGRRVRCMAHFLGTPSRSRLWWSSAHICHGVDEAKKLHKRLLSGPTVDIYVGVERKCWTLHRNLLCHHSSYFETEFEGHEVPMQMRKKEDGGENKLELPDDDPKGFELLVKWLYQGQLEDSSVLTEEGKYDYAVGCHKLYMLCDKFAMIHLKNLAMDLYRANLNTAQLVPDADEINDIYRASPAGSPFRTMMTKIAARQIMDPDVDKDAGTYRKCFQDNPDFAVEMVNAIRYMSGGMLFDDPTEGEECAYHDHSDGSSCGGSVKAEAKTLVNGTGPKPSVAKRQLPAELSAEKRTPRKLNVTQQLKNPTSKPQARRQPAMVNGHAPSTPGKGPSAAPSQPGQTNGHAPSTSAKAQSVAPSQPASVAGGPPKLTQSQSPAVKELPGDSTVLGKRRATDGTANSKPNGAADGPRRSSYHVNGGESGGSDGSQSQAGASELPLRKAAPKLRRAQVNGG